MKLEKYQLIKLDNGKDYTITEILPIDGIEYLMLMEEQNDEVSEDVKYAKVIELPNDEKAISLLEGEELIMASELLLPMFMQEYIE